MSRDSTSSDSTSRSVMSADAAGTDGDAAVRERLSAAPADTGLLREELARRAEAERLIDVAYRVVDSVIGDLLLAATPRGLVYTGFEVEDIGEVLTMLAAKLGPRVVRAEESGTEASARGVAVPGLSALDVLDAAAEQIHQYLDGHRRDFDLSLDTSLATGFRGEVQQHLASLDYGRTVTYKELAVDLGRPGAVRAVGTACATNPLPLVWPCHRVLRTDGGLGGYRGGLDAKRHLLAMEAAA